MRPFYNLPVVPSLLCAEVTTQALMVLPTGFGLTNGLHLVIGN